MLLLLLFELKSPRSSKSKMFVFVAKFVSLFELRAESKNTNKNSCDINLSFKTKNLFVSAKATKFAFDFFSLVWQNVFE